MKNIKNLIVKYFKLWILCLVLWFIGEVVIISACYAEVGSSILS